MFRRLDHVRRDERGMSMVYVALGFMAFFAATTLAIDVGMFMTARSQAQNSADAGALAGVTALVFNNWDDRTPSGPLFGVNTVNISATATAEASPANAVTCVKPFTIPARWTENNVPANQT